MAHTSSMPLVVVLPSSKMIATQAFKSRGFASGLNCIKLSIAQLSDSSLKACLDAIVSPAIAVSLVPDWYYQLKGIDRDLCQ